MVGWVVSMTVETSEPSERSFPASDPSSSGSDAARRASKEPRRVEAPPTDPDIEAAERWEDEGGAVSPCGPAVDPPVSA
jgi:hypothetical protein